MTQTDLLAVLQDVVFAADAEAGVQAKPNVAAVDLDSPIAQFGWDSIRMTWVLVRLEERLNVDTSTLSLFNVHTVGDLLRELQKLKKD